MPTRAEHWQQIVLSVLKRCTSPMSAYDILRELRGAHPMIAPPTVYKALAGLAATGRAHRVESLKAYIACQCDHPEHGAILSICDGCGKVEEHIAPDLLENLCGIVGETGFAPMRQVIEVHGICAACRSV